MPYINETILNSRVSDTPTEPNTARIYNLNNTGFVENAFFISGLYDYQSQSDFNYRYEDPLAPDVIDLVNSYPNKPFGVPYPSLTASQTGMTVANGFTQDTSYTYYLTREGWIKVQIDGTIKNIRVKAYHGYTPVSFGMGNGPGYFLEILEIPSKSAELGWVNHLGFDPQNDPRIVVGGLSYSFASEIAFSTTNIPNNGSVVFNFRLNVSTSDIQNSNAGEVLMMAEIKDGSNTLIFPGNNSVSTFTAQELQLSVILQNVELTTNPVLTVRLITSDIGTV